MVGCIFTVVAMTYTVTYREMPTSAPIAGVLIASLAQFSGLPPCSYSK